MQSYRSLSRLPVSSRLPITQAKRALLTTPIRKMSFFPRTFISNDPTSFHPLFRLLDDFDSYTKSTPSTSSTAAEGHNLSKQLRNGALTMSTFSPKFDVKELRDAYELHGELPGIDQRDVEIEFTDSQTVIIRGRTEREFTSGTPPAQAAISNEKARQPTIEDGEEGDNEGSARASTATTSADDNNAVATTTSTTEQQLSQEKYWVSERSVGEFSRSFTFPVRVDSDLVRASMRNGILSIVVPKAKKDHARKITIS